MKACISIYVHFDFSAKNFMKNLKTP